MFSSVKQYNAQQTYKNKKKTKQNKKKTMANVLLTQTSTADPATVTGRCEITMQCGTSNHNKLLYIHKTDQWSTDTPFFFK